MATQTATQATQTAPETKNRFNEAMVNWDEMSKFGISKDYLIQKGLLNDMLKGYKSKELVPVNMNFGSVVVKTDARLSLRQSNTGPVVLAIHGVRQKPDLDRPYFGHVFSAEDKKNIMESDNMGRAVSLRVGNNDPVFCLVSIDKLTNELACVRQENLYIPNEISGVKLTEQDKTDLRDGKAIHLEGMVGKNGKEFSVPVQYNAEKRFVDYLFDKEHFNRQSIGNVQLTKTQLEDLNCGKTIFIEDMKTKDGRINDSFINLGKGGNLNFLNYNPDTPEGDREIIIPKEVLGLKLSGEQRDVLRKGEPIFLEGMITRKGEEIDRFVKLDTETGKVQYSQTRTFDEQPAFKIPNEYFGAELKASQRADLQDGKVVHLTGLKSFDGKTTFSQYLQLNRDKSGMNSFDYDPTQKKADSRQQTSGKQEGNAEKQVKAEKAEKKQTAGKARKITV